MRECENCKSKTTNPRFCSRTCAAKFNNKVSPKRKLKCMCSTCGKLVRSTRRKCSECSEKYLIQNLPLSHFTHMKNVGSNRYGAIRFHARKIAKTIENSCKNCGYDKHVEVCHIVDIKDHKQTDTIVYINRIENLVKLCPNCHWEFDNGIIDLVEADGIEPSQER